MASLMVALSIVVGMVVVGTAAPASAEISRVGVVTTLDGTATLSRVALPQGVPLKVRDDVFVADRIVTGDNSFARILFGGKAIVTVRERSVLTITEAPGTSTVDVSIGRVAVAVVKERMKPGESVEIRTPNAVAGIRGTVVIAEVDQATSQLAAPSGGFTTTITVLKGRIEFRQLDRLTRQPSGPGVSVGALQRVRVTGFATPRPVQKVPTDVQQQLITDFRVPLRTASATTNGVIAEGQMRQAVSAVGAQLGALNTAASDSPASAKSEDNQGVSGKASEDNQGRNAKSSEDNQGPSGKSSADNNQGSSGKNSADNQGSSGKKSSADNNQGSSGKSSADNQGRSGNSSASGHSSSSGTSGSSGSSGTSSVTSSAGGGGGGGTQTGSAPAAAPATSTGTTRTKSVTTSTPATTAAPAPGVSSPTTSGGTTGTRNVPATTPVVSVPSQNVNKGNQGWQENSIQKAIEKASKSRSKSKK